jgi:tRNA threonylcarbamoyladenosine biosynthesis protein TsaB
MSATVRKPNWLLAIDTSTERAGLALTDGAETAELSWYAGRDQTVAVLEQIDHLLSLEHIDAARLAAIAVATGPGMFNGLRVGMSLAKGLYLASGTRLIGVSTLAATAEPFRGLVPNVAAVVAAGRGRMVWQIFPGDAEPVNGTADELAAAVEARPGDVLIAGDLDPAQAERLTGAGGALVPEPTLRQRRPGTLAALGWQRLRAGAFDDPVALAPVYVHSSATAGRG